MPAFTPNRNYPYSINSDPADIPAAIEALARAVDLDVENLDNSILQRPFAKASSHSTTPQAFPSAVVTPMLYDFVDHDSDALVDLVSAPDRMTVTTTGLWFVWGSVILPNFSYSSKNLHVLKNGVSSERNSMYFDIPGRLITTSIGAVLHAVPGDYFQVALQPNSFTGNVNVTSKQMAVFRLTNT
jgi:hypothetical protein